MRKLTALFMAVLLVSTFAVAAPAGDTPDTDHGPEAAPDKGPGNNTGKPTDILPSMPSLPDLPDQAQAGQVLDGISQAFQGGVDNLGQRISGIFSGFLGDNQGTGGPAEGNETGSTE